MKHKINAADLIKYEDDNYIVINKPAFVSTLEDRSDPLNILNLFREVDPNMQVCHRLDKETSGALLLAKNEDAYRHAAMQFEKREVSKVYHSLVRGHFTNEVLKVEMPMKVAGSGKVKIDKRNGKEAQTIFRLSEQIGHFSLVEAKPISGRRHQIRVHLAYLDFPICGDTLYGGEPIFLSHIKKKYKLTIDKEERPLFDRVALHAYSLELTNLDGTVLKVVCDYPKDLTMIIEKLKKFG